MAGIRAGQGIVGKVQTQVGEKILVKMPNNGGIGVRNTYKPSTSHTDKQLEVQMRSSNVMAFYTLVKKFVPHCWQEQITINKKTGAKYKARPVDLFKQANMSADVPVYGMSPEEYDKGGVVLAPYQLSQGDLVSASEVRVDVLGSGERSFETVGELSRAILKHNSGWNVGDVLFYVEMQPYMERNVMKARVSYSQVQIWQDSDEKLSGEGVTERGFSAKDGLLGNRDGVKVAYCYIHAQVGVDKKTHYSTQRLIVDDIQDWLAAYSDPKRVEDAMAGFRKQAVEREKAKMAAYEQKQHGLTKEDIKAAVKEAVVEALREVFGERKTVFVMTVAMMMQFAICSNCKAGNMAQQWLESGVWRNGFTVNPSAETDAEVFYEQYQLAPQMWDSIFAWLASIDSITMETSKKAMVWSHAYAKVLDQDLRTPENCQWEQHRRTIDLQWDATGSERYRLTRHPELLEAKNEYNPKKDVQNFRMSGTPRPGECLILDSNPQTFYLFFPNDIHEACGIAGELCTPRKIVVKIDYLEPSAARSHWGAEIDARHDSILSLISGADNADQPVVSIRQLGAKPMTVTSRPDCLPAFRKAMQRASRQKNGLRVVVPAGDWFVKGPIHLVSHVTLELQEGAHLFFSDDAGDYLPMVKTSWEGNFCYNYSPFIYGYGLTDVAIVGRGTIDGNCPNTFPTWRKEQKPDQMQLREQCHTDVPYEERIFGEGHLLRPHLIQLYNCSNITLENVMITNSPFWCIHLFRCENIICRGLRYDAKLINNDGIDPEMSRNILIENIEFNNGDDNVAIKAGRDNDGWREARPSENIIIRNCRFKGLHGVVIGSEMSAGVRNVFVENCTYGGYNKRALYVKTNPNRGGFVHDIYFRNCEFGEMEDLFYITSMYAGEGADDNHYTDVHDIHAKDIHAERVNNAAIVLQGTAALPLRNISFERVVVDSCRIGFSATYAPNVCLTDCHLGGRVQSAPSQAAHTDHVFDRK